MQKKKGILMSTLIMKVLFNEELIFKILLDYPDSRTIPSIKNMIGVAKACKLEHNMEEFQAWLANLIRKIAIFEDVIDALVQNLDFDQVCLGMNECIHEERTTKFVCLALVRLVQNKKPVKIMESGIISGIARSMTYWSMNSKVQNYWMYCLLQVHSQFSHNDDNGLVYKHTYPIMEEISQWHIEAILETGVINSVSAAIKRVDSDLYTRESGLNILFKVFCQCNRFEPRVCVQNKPSYPMKREISTFLKLNLVDCVVSVIFSIIPTVCKANEFVGTSAEMQIWDYSMILLLFLIHEPESNTDVEWSSFESLTLVLSDTTGTNKSVVSKLNNVHVSIYLFEILDKLVQQGNDPKNISQTILVLGQLCADHPERVSQFYSQENTETLLKLYIKMRFVFTDCDNDLTTHNGAWLYNTTMFYLATILSEIAIHCPMKILSLRCYQSYFQSTMIDLGSNNTNLNKSTKTKIEILNQTIINLKKTHNDCTLCL